MAAWEDATQREEQWADNQRWIHIVTIAGFFTLYQRFGNKLKVIFMDEFSEIFKVCHGPKSKRETQRFEVLEAVLSNSVVTCFDSAFMWHVWAFMHQTCWHFYILLSTAYNPYKHHMKLISYSCNHEAFSEACDLQEREGTPFLVMANTKHGARLIASKIVHHQANTVVVGMKEDKDPPHPMLDLIPPGVDIIVLLVGPHIPYVHTPKSRAERALILMWLAD